MTSATSHRAACLALVLFVMTPAASQIQDVGFHAKHRSKGNDHSSIGKPPLLESGGLWYRVVLAQGYAEGKNITVEKDGKAIPLGTGEVKLKTSVGDEIGPFRERKILEIYEKEAGDAHSDWMPHVKKRVDKVYSAQQLVGDIGDDDDFVIRTYGRPSTKDRGVVCPEIEQVNATVLRELHKHISFDRTDWSGTIFGGDMPGWWTGTILGESFIMARFKEQQEEKAKGRQVAASEVFYAERADGRPDWNKVYLRYPLSKSSVQIGSYILVRCLGKADFLNDPPPLEVVSADSFQTFYRQVTFEEMARHRSRFPFVFADSFLGRGFERGERVRARPTTKKEPRGSGGSDAPPPAAVFMASFIVVVCCAAVVCFHNTIRKGTVRARQAQFEIGLSSLPPR